MKEAAQRDRRLYWPGLQRFGAGFPPAASALREPDGLLAVGGDLESGRLLKAYRSGIFPWYEEGQPILWWSPDPRCVLFPERFTRSGSLKKTLKKEKFTITFDQAFDAVIRSCARTHARRHHTWITPEMILAYNRLHRQGHAHSVEAWQDGKLAGGLYGLRMGGVFFGESMFSHVSDASKAALATLVAQTMDLRLIDCQVDSPHLRRLGAECIARQKFIRLLKKWI